MAGIHKQEISLDIRAGLKRCTGDEVFLGYYLFLNLGFSQPQDFDAVTLI